MNIAVIFAGGTGTRMNTKSRPKQFLEIHNKPVLIYTMEKFQEVESIDGIVLVCLKNWIKYAQKICNDWRISKLISIVPGGSNGQESIFFGIREAMKHSKGEKDIVLIHDGVRPMVDVETINLCIDTVDEYGSAITTAPAIETIFANSSNGYVGEIFNRSQCLMARAPQCFFLREIYQAHLNAQRDGSLDFIDSAMLMQHYGMLLHTVDGPVENIKITTPTDFYLFKALLDAKENMQIVGL